MPLLKQTVGSVVSSNPEHIAFRTAPFSNFPGKILFRIGTPDDYLSQEHRVQTSILSIIDNKSRQYGNITSRSLSNLPKLILLNIYILLHWCNEWINSNYKVQYLGILLFFQNRIISISIDSSFKIGLSVSIIYFIIIANKNHQTPPQNQHHQTRHRRRITRQSYAAQSPLHHWTYGNTSIAWEEVWKKELRRRWEVVEGEERGGTLQVLEEREVVEGEERSGGFWRHCYARHWRLYIIRAFLFSELRWVLYGF